MMLNYTGKFAFFELPEMILELYHYNYRTFDFAAIAAFLLLPFGPCLP
jgi:hypothetical protein